MGREYHSDVVGISASLLLEIASSLWVNMINIET
jgi:hypothetical protein